MKCCSQCEGLSRVFDDRTARRDLEAYRKHGPDGSTRLLLDALRERFGNDAVRRGSDLQD